MAGGLILVFFFRNHGFDERIICCLLQTCGILGKIAGYKLIVNLEIY